MAREAAELIEAHGFRTIKFKGGQGFDIDFEDESGTRHQLLLEDRPAGRRSNAIFTAPRRPAEAA